MPPELTAVGIFVGLVACLMTGYYLGFAWGLKCGKAKAMTKEQAARIMAKASWAKRPQYAGSVRSSFFRTVNK